MAQFPLCVEDDVRPIADLDTPTLGRLIPLASEIMETDAEYGLNRLVQRQTHTNEERTAATKLRVYVKNPPAWSVSKLEFYDGLSWVDVTSDYTIQTDANRSGVRSMGEVMIDGYTFPMAENHVRLTYVGGLATDPELLPLKIRTATAHLVAGLWQFEKRKGSAFNTRTLETGETVGFFEKLFTPLVRGMISQYRVGRI